MKFCLAKIILDKEVMHRDVEKFRGFIGNKFIECDIFHNHKSEHELEYRFPKIQYKYIDGSIAMFAIEDTIGIMKKKLKKLDFVELGNDKIDIKQILLEEYNDDFSVDSELHEYEFQSIWLALNQNNYSKYINGEIDLNKQIQNNILSNFKGLGIKVEERIMSRGCFTEERITLKNTIMLGFKGKFITNVKIPRYMSIGKRQSIGYGLIKKTSI